MGIVGVHGEQDVPRLGQLASLDQTVTNGRPEPLVDRMLLEDPLDGDQYNLDGYVLNGEVRALGVVRSVKYPGTQAIKRFVYPGGLAEDVGARAQDVARRFLAAVGFDHGLFNMEFFHDPASGRISVIEFNPRMASQFSDLYLRVDG